MTIMDYNCKHKNGKHKLISAKHVYEHIDDDINRHRDTLTS